MGKRIFKKVLIFSLVLLMVFQQGSFFMGTAASSSSDNTKLSLALEGDPTLESTIISIEQVDQEIQEEEGVQKVELQVPQAATFDVEKTKALKQEQASITYNFNDQKVIIEWNTASLQQQVKVVFKDLAEPNYLFIAEGINGEAKVKSNGLSIQMPAPIVEEVAEEVEVVEEKPAEETEAVEEKKPAEEVEAVKEEPAEKAEAVEEKKEKEEQTKSVEDSKKVSSKATQSSTAYPNLELYFESLSEEVESGKTANFELNVKVTGSQTTYTNGEIVVNLPKHPEVPVIYPQIPDGVPNESLTIAGVSPVYDAAAGTLTYHFPELKSGQVYKTIIEAVPELGETPASDKENNKRLLEADASIKVDEVSEAIESEIESTMVISNGAVSISKAYTTAERYIDGQYEVIDGAPYHGDLSTWTIKANIPKSAAGLSYIQENSKIYITDVVPEGLNFGYPYQKNDFNGTYDEASRTVTWEFDAPTFSEQDQANENLFEVELQVVLYFSYDLEDYSTLRNTANVSYDVHGSTEASPIKVEDSNTRSVQIGGSGVEVPEIDGAWFHGFHGGAEDGRGNAETIWKQNLGQSVPSVSDEARLTFYNEIAIDPWGNWYRINAGNWYNSDVVGTYTDPNYPEFHERIVETGYKHYTMEYTIDEKLDLTHLEFFKPWASYHTSIPLHQLEQVPDTFVQLKVNGQWKSEYPVHFPSGDYSFTGELDVMQFGKQEGEHIEAYRVIYKNASGKMTADVFSSYDVYEGATGKATNGATYNFELNDGTKVELVPINDESVHGNRHVNIVQPFDTEPIVQTSIQFVDGADVPLANGSNVQRGNNRIQIDLTNTKASQDNVRGPVELVALLPKGVNILDQPNIIFGDNSEVPTYEIIGEVDGQQQIKFVWENKRLLPGEKLTASFDVDVTRTAPSELLMEVFGFVGNDKFKVPSVTGESLTNSVLQTDENDINDNGNTTEKRVRSANQYSITKQDNLQITKEVKGSLDDEYSLFGYTTPDGDVTYRFNLTNTTNEVIEQFTFLDVLPSVGDLGITDNKERESKFEVTLKGPISFVGTKWEDQVTVYYSTSKNPKRDDLYATVDFPDGSSPYQNPGGAEDPNWVVAADVSDWDSIHSFMIVMKEGVEWLEGQDIEFEVAAKAPALPLDRELFDKDIDEVDRAAWNSYAVTTNGLLAVEPLRVGVVMELDIVEPEVEKTVNDQKETVELLNRDEVFTWKVDYDFGSYTTDWESVQLSDQIHELLDIERVKVVDQDGNDVSGNGELTTVDNLVKFEVNKKDGSFAYLADQTYTLIIESKIKDSATDEQLQPFVEGNGIPNEGVLTIDDDPKESNEVFVKPPGHGSLEIIKVDDTTGTVLQGAEFELRACEDDAVDANDEEKCKVIASGTTDENGKLLFDDIPLGDYKLVETKAPEGYNLLTSPLDIKIVDAGQVLAFEVENTKTGWDLPNTGGMGTILFYAVGALLMIGAALFLRRKRNTDV